MKNILDSLEKPQLKGKKSQGLDIDVDEAQPDTPDEQPQTLDWMQFFKKLASLPEDKLSKIAEILNEQDTPIEPLDEEQNEELPV